MPHWVYAGIHLYLHLPAIHAYAYTYCVTDSYANGNTQRYSDGHR